MSDIGERVATLEAYQRTMHDRLATMEATLNKVATDMHGAKIAGRIILAVALAVGSAIGWFASNIFGG